MHHTRLIARLDVKAPFLIKGINLEGVRKIGLPNDFAVRYYKEGIDEILYMDAVASLYDRNSLADVVQKTADDVFVPMAVGGGLRTLDDIHRMMRAGADKVAINTAAVKRPDFLTEIAEAYGSQATVLSVEAKRHPNEARWEAYVDNGREKTGLDVIDWVIRAEELGAGEILLTSVDQEGMQSGYDIELVRAVSLAVNIPIVASGGMGKPEHLSTVIKDGGASAVAIAHALHYGDYSISELKDHLIANDIQVRDL